DAHRYCILSAGPDREPAGAGTEAAVLVLYLPDQQIDAAIAGHGGDGILPRQRRLAWQGDLDDVAGLPVQWLGWFQTQVKRGGAGAARVELVPLHQMRGGPGYGLGMARLGGTQMAQLRLPGVQRVAV